MLAGTSALLNINVKRTLPSSIVCSITRNCLGSRLTRNTKIYMWGNRIRTTPWYKNNRCNTRFRRIFLVILCIDSGTWFHDQELGKSVSRHPSSNHAFQGILDHTSNRHFILCFCSHSHVLSVRFWENSNNFSSVP